MKTRTLLCLLAGLALSRGGFAEEAAPAIQMLSLGQYHGDEVPQASGSAWYALTGSHDKPGGWALQAVTLQLDTVYDALLDDEEKGPYTGKVVNTVPAVGATVLIQHPALKAGPVPAAEIQGDARGIGEKQITLQQRRYTLRLNEGCSSVEGACQWLLSDGEHSQAVVQELYMIKTPEGVLDTDSGNTGLVWAGDLDGDGKLDLLLDVSNHYNAVINLRLFLSSHAKDGQLVEEVAAFHAVGC